jgi:hypothetical protein
MSYTPFMGLVAGMLCGCGVALDAFAGGIDVIAAAPISSPATSSAAPRGDNHPDISGIWTAARL